MSEKFPPRISVMPSMADLLSKGADKKHEVAEIYVHESLLQAEREKVKVLRKALGNLQKYSEIAICGAHGAFLPGQILDYNLADHRAKQALAETEEK